MSTLIDKARIARKAALKGLTAAKTLPARSRLSAHADKPLFLSSRRPIAEPEVLEPAALPRILPRPPAPRRLPGLDLLEGAGLWASYGARLQ